MKAMRQFGSRHRSCVRPGQSVAVPGNHRPDIVAALHAGQQMGKAGALHLAAADRIIGVDVGQLPALLPGERFELRPLLVQRFFLAVRGSTDVADGLDHDGFPRCDVAPCARMFAHWPQCTTQRRKSAARPSGYAGFVLLAALLCSASDLVA